MINPVVYGLKHEIEMIKKGDIPIPRMAIITPTYKCNQACYYCFFKELNKSGDTIEPNRLVEILNQVNDIGCQSYELCGGGEALLVPKIIDAVEHSANIGLHPGLLTNGVLFCDDVANTFLKYATYVRFSLDTVNNELYKKIRGVDNCELVKKNILGAMETKKKYDYTCQISIKIALTQYHTIKEIQEVFDFFEGMDIHSIQIKNAWDERGNYYNTDLIRTDIYRMLSTHGIPFSKKVGTRRKMHEQCWLNPVQVTIDCHGDVYLCCYFQYRAKSHKIGNLFEVPLTKIWGSKQHLDAIKNVKINECMKHDCRFIRYMDQANYVMKTGEWYHV